MESDVGPKASSVVRANDTPRSRSAYGHLEKKLFSEKGASRESSLYELQTILLIEEDDDLRAARSKFLCAAGYFVATCKDTQMAADVYRSNLTIDLVLRGLCPSNNSGTYLEDLDFVDPNLPILLSAPAFPLNLWHELRVWKWRFLPEASSPSMLLSTIRSLLRSDQQQAA